MFEHLAGGQSRWTSKQRTGLGREARRKRHQPRTWGSEASRGFYTLRTPDPSNQPLLGVGFAQDKWWEQDRPQSRGEWSAGQVVKAGAWAPAYYMVSVSRFLCRCLCLRLYHSSTSLSSSFPNSFISSLLPPYHSHLLALFSISGPHSLLKSFFFYVVGNMNTVPSRLITSLVTIHGG